MEEELSGWLFAAVLQAPNIACDETKTGSIDQTDQALMDGTRFDLYSLATQQANQPFLVTFQSSSFAGVAQIYSANAQGQLTFISSGVASRNTTVQFTGTLTTAGQYALVVLPVDSPQSRGAYSLKLECKSCGAAPPKTCAGGTIQNPIPIQLDQPQTCEITADDTRITDSQMGVHFGKFFTFQATGGPIRITASSQAYTPLILILQNGQITQVSRSPFTFSFPAGAAIFAVSSDETQKTGQFTVQIAR